MDGPLCSCLAPDGHDLDIKLSALDKSRGWLSGVVTHFFFGRVNLTL